MSAAAAVQPRMSGFTLDQRDFAQVAALVYKEAGIVLPAGKMQLVNSRLGKRLRARGLERFADYLALVEKDPEERQQAIDALTTNHTKFFREQHHFEHLAADVWPKLSRKLDQGGRVRIWSAACSSGEEPYTLLMTLLGGDRGAASRLRSQDFQMLATDISREVLHTARAGRYPAASMEGTPASLRHWMKPSGDQMEMDPAVRGLVSFRPLNFLDPWPMKGKFDVIFCRNAMIYFDEPTKAQLQSRFGDQMVPEGTLYIGHSERLCGPAADRFKPIGQTIYRKVKA